jgi:hypothetical protein
VADGDVVGSGILRTNVHANLGIDEPCQVLPRPNQVSPCSVTTVGRDSTILSQVSDLSIQGSADLLLALR